jgi:hypothetical protein
MIGSFLAPLLLLAAAPAASGQPGLILKSGTPVPLVTGGEISTKTHREGDRIALAVAEDVRVDGHVAIPRGAPAVAEVTRRLPNGAYGKAGRLEVRLLHVTAGGRQIRLDGDVRQKGAANVAPAAAAGLAVLAIAFFIEGKSATIPAGSRITGYVHRDLPLRVVTTRD